MGFLTGMFSAVVKVALSPVAIVKDVANVAIGEDVDATKSLLGSAVDDAEDAMDDLIGEGDGGLL